jgi:hypothetical protein
MNTWSCLIYFFFFEGPRVEIWNRLPGLGQGMKLVVASVFRASAFSEIRVEKFWLNCVNCQWLWFPLFYLSLVSLGVLFRSWSLFVFTCSRSTRGIFRSCLSCPFEAVSTPFLFFRRFPLKLRVMCLCLVRLWSLNRINGRVCLSEWAHGTVVPVAWFEIDDGRRRLVRQTVVVCPLERKWTRWRRRDVGNELCWCWRHYRDSDEPRFEIGFVASLSVQSCRPSCRFCSMASFSRGTQFPEMETTSDFVENGHIGIESSAITVVIISRIRCPLLHLCRLFLFRYQWSRKNRRFVHILCTIVLGHFVSPTLSL